MSKLKLLCFALLLLPQFCIAQSSKTARLDSLFSLLDSKNKMMGSVKLTAAGQTFYEKSIGFAEINDIKKKPANRDTRYRVGSITKTFTATMILQLVEEKKLDLTTTLDKYFPTVPNAAQITMRMLLNHRSGIHNYTNDASFLRTLTKSRTAEEMTNVIMGQKSDSQPDQRTEYSNSNYVLLGFIIEKITGKSYAENLEKHILAKLGLKNTRYDGKTDIEKNDTYSYDFVDKWVKHDETDLSNVLAAGSIISTTSDLTAFIDGLFSGKLISTESLEKMKTITDGMGLGMIRVPFYDEIGYGHNGSLDGYQSTLYHFPKDKVTVAILSNGTAYALNDVVIALLSAYYDKPFQLPNLNVAKLSPEELGRYEGIYSSDQIPLKITITPRNGTINAQATGQPEFPLMYNGGNIFRFDQAGIVMEFRPEQKEFTLKQGGVDYLFKIESIRSVN
ncbi:serine hydrolase [Dyadobacter sp. CY326]|uniref:serine hydrolase domain-containing protein n=1 Tax=Dyadobacter sp. CY326 TaxID=2907300 RepID=UPI001F1F0DCF|nr:serine hydrolase domain-containing protein [Dyadobacter sp. CY326]MCE7064964.1 beta-lactamase family protein [Dyadobacter sp. CY326]